jgi:hypothetical protein
MIEIKPAEIGLKYVKARSFMELLLFGFVRVYP